MDGWMDMEGWMRSSQRASMVRPAIPSASVMVAEGYRDILG